MDLGHRDHRLLPSLLRHINLDPVLLGAILILGVIGLAVLYSASGGNVDIVTRQAIRLVLALLVMVVVAMAPPQLLYQWTPAIYFSVFAMLVLVPLTGSTGKGAQRWLDIGIVRFQPAEIMKIAMPMMIAFYFAERRLRPRLRELTVALALVLGPAFFIFIQPDLGTALLIATAGLTVIFLAGIRWRTVILTALGSVAALPLLWHFMHDYQRRRVETFLDPESDPLGAGYHIIQSKIALGSGGIYGRGWQNGSQTQLDFLPEQTTDFVFSVFGEEFGLLGVLLLFALYLLIVLRGFLIAWRAQDTYARLLAASITMIFFTYFFVNVGMVSGLLPVVGVPLPLISYGGSSMVTIMVGFGILMSINSEKRLLSK